MICNPTLQIQLLANLTTSTKSSPQYFGSKFRSVHPNAEEEVLGGQETAFIVLDLKCSPAEIQGALRMNKFNVIYSRWLVLHSGHSLGAVDELLLQSVLVDTPIAQSTELFYFKETPDSLLLKQAFKRLKVDNSTVVLENYGEFLLDDMQTFRNLREINTTTVRRKDLNGSTFELAITVEDMNTLNHLTDFKFPEVDPLTKNGLRLAKVILENMNARHSLVVSNQGWGNANPATNNWTGMLGEMKAGRAEFAGSPTLLRDSRLEAVDYASYSIETWSRLVFRAPKLSYTTNVFLLPFDKFVWICAICLIGIIMGLLLVSTWSEWNILIPANAMEADRDMLLPRISDVIFVVLTNVFVQGSPAVPRSTGGRIIIIFCLILIVVLYVSYCAFIVALLQSPATNIKTVSDLLNSHIQVGVQDTVYFRFWMPVRL